MVLVIIGVMIMVYSGFNYITTERVVDFGGLHINKETKHRVPISPIVGIIFLVGGLFILNKGKSS